MKKICFVSDFAYPLFNTASGVTHGGAEMDAYAIADELAKHPEFSISFVVGDFGQKETERYGEITLYRSFRTNLKGLKRLLYATFIAIPKLFIALHQAKADIYFQEGAGYETLLVAMYCKLTRTHFFYRVPSRVECTSEILKLWPIMGRAFRIGLRMADAIVTQDQNEVELLQKNLGLNSQAIYSTTPIPSNDEVLSVTQRHYVLWVSRLVQMKHPEIFLQIAKKYPTEKFVLNGPSAPNNASFDSELQLQASRLQNVTFYHGLKRTELDNMYREAKLYINTSDFEGFPLAFIEAGKYCVPVLTLNVDPEKILSEKKFGECANGNIENLVSLVGAWLKDAAKRERAGRAFREYVLKTNDIKKNIHAYIAIFNQLLLKK